MHNLRLYKKLGINKRYYSSISSKDFANILPTSSNEQDTKSNIAETALFKSADEQTKQSILGFKENGYIVLKNYLSEDKVDEINSEIEKALNEKRVKFKYRNKIMFAIDKLNVLKQVGLDHKLTSFLSALMKGEAILFQSINFLSGSEQKTHSDSIHMTTYPLGGLLGVWIALEDISADNGPLHYYPGSHKLPYYLNSDYDNEGNKFLIGDKDYTEYEKMIAEKISDKHLKKETFLASKGDVLVWHANLFHGGEPHTDKTKTRKSMVFHYFNKNCICYHEISQRPSLFK
jgi:ectoine hydroxylase-related dioxygenase (phytanoyl-CoA dioxygenase family)